MTGSAQSQLAELTYELFRKICDESDALIPPWDKTSSAVRVLWRAAISATAHHAADVQEAREAIARVDMLSEAIDKHGPESA